MKTTIDIPEPLYRKAKIRAAETGTTLKQIVLTALGKELDGSDSPTPAGRSFLERRTLLPEYEAALKAGAYSREEPIPPLSSPKTGPLVKTLYFDTTYLPGLFDGTRAPSGEKPAGGKRQSCDRLAWEGGILARSYYERDVKATTRMRICMPLTLSSRKTVKAD